MFNNIEHAVSIARNSHQSKLSAFLTSDAHHDAKSRLAKQIIEFDKHYPGGLASYTHKIKNLIEEYSQNKTKYDDVTLKTPATVKLTWDDLDFVRKTDKEGIPELKKCAFFLLAGGLGERLGYNGAKPCMNLDSISRMSFLQLYSEYILAYQELFGMSRPLTKGQKKLLFHLF